MKKLCFLGLVGALGLLATRLAAQDYPIKPVPADFSVDANTTFLVDLTSAKDQADFAAGSAQLKVDPANFEPGLGYKGVVGLATPGNFPTNAWTLEMIVRVPYSANALNSITVADWESNSKECEFTLSLDHGFGVKSKFYCWDPLDGFMTQPYAGGNGSSVQGSAPDKWVYIAFGCDFNNQILMTSAREVTGELLNKDIHFKPVAQVDTNFLSGFSLLQGASELLRRWTSLGLRFTGSLPATLNLGNSVMEIKKIRLSNKYRPEIFRVDADLPVGSATTWVPQNMDASRAQTQTVNRNVGYGGYKNYVCMPVNEAYLPLAPGDAPIVLQLTNVPVGLYKYYVYGAVAPKGRTSLNRVWQPCPMAFTARDAGGKDLGHGVMLLKQSLIPRLMQGFSFHVDEQTTNVTLTFQVTGDAQETAWLQRIVATDQLEGFPDAAIKTSQNLGAGAHTQLTTLTAAREQRDDLIWNGLPPLNTPLQVHDQVAQFRQPPTGVTLDQWIMPALGAPNGTNVNRYCDFAHAFDPLEFVNKTTGQTFPASSTLANVPWPGNDPDPGYGIYFRSNQYSSLATDIYFTRRAELLGYRYLLYQGALTDIGSNWKGVNLPGLYYTNGDANIGHDAAMALVRWAYDWPALEMTLHEVRLSTHSPDLEYNVDWSAGVNRNGKMHYTGWSGYETTELFTAYDQVFPYIQGNQVFADAVHRFIPAIKTPADVIKFLDQRLIYSSVRDMRKGLIDPSINLEDWAGEVLGYSPYTADFYDLTKQYNATYPISGTYQEIYGTGLSRSGVYYIGSYMVYAFGGAADLMRKAGRFREAAASGVNLPMNISDVDRYPKIRSAANFMLDMWVAGGFPFMAGDASGGTHSGLEATNRLAAVPECVAEAFALTGDARQAWVLKNILGSSDVHASAIAAGGSNPILNAPPHVVPDYGAILELTPNQNDVLKKTSATLRLGIGQGHSHSDYLDLDLFGMGLPLAVDLACRNEGSFWSRPSASWSFLHNHAMAHDSADPNGAGVQDGEPYLRAFAPPVMRATYVSKTGTQLDRDVIFTEDGDGTGNFYAVDLQRLTGGTYHTWCFHGCESDDLKLNVAMAPGTNRWTDRCLEGTQKIATTTTNLLQATWTMTRTGSNFPYTFNGGGTVHTVGCEPTALGTAYDPSRPLVHVRATLLNRPNDGVFQANAYSDVYQYCFPFLWAQSTNEAQSVYPAVYEWYRGNTPTVASMVLDQADNPVRLTVTTSSGQVDRYEFATNHCQVISRDSQGAVRWVKLNGENGVTLSDLTINPVANYAAVITSIDYVNRRLTTSAPLPANPAVNVGNASRQIYLQLTGPAGTEFTWADDLLVQEGQITSLHVL
ncbi:MAG TPA: hypothetical protein VL527_14715, partial [Dongiaceae bacterium]|nr:hypothetical protein [Dongiaceae bacterium]